MISCRGEVRDASIPFQPVLLNFEVITWNETCDGIYTIPALMVMTFCLKMLCFPLRNQFPMEDILPQNEGGGGGRI